jgi:hypothetical protein
MTRAHGAGCSAHAMMARPGCRQTAGITSAGPSRSRSVQLTPTTCFWGRGGLFRSRNGGRDWKIEAPSVVIGSVFAAAFGADGRRALISTGLGIFRGEDGNNWRPLSAPQSATPARAIVSSGEVGGFYLAGWTDLYRSHDWGVTWSSAADSFPQEPVTALLTLRGRPETLYAIVQGQLWASIDGGRSWARRGNGISPANADALAEDLRQPGDCGLRQPTGCSGAATAARAGSASDRLFRSRIPPCTGLLRAKRRSF